MPICENWVAKIASIQGKVDVQYWQKPIWEQVNEHTLLCPGDKIRTAKYSRLVLMFTNQAVATLDQNSTLMFPLPEKKARSWLLNLLEGAALFRSRKDQQLDINTPFLNAVHKGTEFLLTVSQNNTKVSVFDGEVIAENQAGQAIIKNGFSAQAQFNQPPQITALTVQPNNAVQWALYYPPIIDDATQQATLAKTNQQSALKTYQRGNISDTLSALDEVPKTYQDSHYLIFKASLLLNVGRVDEAQSNIQKVLQLEPNNSNAKALQAIIAVVQNQSHAALDFAHQAIAAQNTSPVAHIALSYSYQSLFKIQEALLATKTATELAPNNALAWARLAELQLSVGEADLAIRSAHKAQTLNPNLAKIQSTYGFANLAQNQISQSETAFNQAIELDSSDPIARLGLALTKIRQNQLEEGKTELEIAVNLDPNNSVIRSYLGKTFYELKNKHFASTEFDIAKTMDSKDPTPWFYDAILKQTTNRPVEALHDMQKAIALNDNRAVYRSKLLLDSDSAARSASLGRIYNDLGFQQRGLLEGWNAINSDPSNYSAHRLLADNYAALPRHEVARLSELLKAQLLQPINITPVQPQAAEANILLLDGLGPSITSFNEYNPLFTRNRFALQATGFYGSNDTKSDEIVHSGVWNKFSYSLGQFHYQTQGFRPNNAQKKDAYNLFAQAQITHDTNAQIEFRRSEHDFGDISQSFFTNNFSQIKNGSKDSDVIRFGLHHKLNAQSDLLASLQHREEDFSNDDGNETIGFSAHGTQYETQYLYRHTVFDITAGMNYLFNRQGELREYDSELTPYFKSKNLSEHGAFYLYTNFKVIPNVLLTAGVSQDFYQNKRIPTHGAKQIAEFNVNPLSPKFGLTWTPSKDTTFRFAAFRALKRDIVQKQTLEPTQIAGFNQFFDDPDGTITKRIGFGLDHKFNNQLFVGAEISKRYLEVPFAVLDSVSYAFNKTKWQEKNARAYVNWTPQDWITFGANYNYENFNRNDTYYDNLNNKSHFFTQLETHRSELFSNFYHPSGLIAKLNLAYLNQSGIIAAQDFTLTPQTSKFWLLDTEIAYRLPKRYGLIALGVKNLLDERFNFQGTDFNAPTLTQGRFFFSRLTLSF